MLYPPPFAAQLADKPLTKKRPPEPKVTDRTLTPRADERPEIYRAYFPLTLRHFAASFDNVTSFWNGGILLTYGEGPSNY
jgi:hypothetical protein